jgi:serine/threonine protein kinase
MAPRAPKEPPPSIPGYEIVEAIGSGGQGSVWRARQLSLDRIVAIKVLWAEDAADPVLAQRFVDEARIASKLNHPNIIQVIDVGETDGTYWYAMEFVAGVTALDLFRERGPLPEGEVLEIAWQVAQALQHGADRGLIHGDLKPENILITPEGVAKVVDFGLARLSRKRGKRPGRGEEIMHGTEGFVAPEILKNRSTGDERTDLFALGVTLFELLTTTLPPGPRRGATTGPDPRERRPNTTRRTAELIMRLLSPDPEQRPQSPGKVLEELGRRTQITLPASVSPVAPVKPPQSTRLRTTREISARNRRRVIVVAGAIVGAVAVVGAVLLLKSLLGGPAKPEARTPAPTPPVVESKPADKKPVAAAPAVRGKEPERAPPSPTPPPRGAETRSEPVDDHRVSPPIVTPPVAKKDPPPENGASRAAEPEREPEPPRATRAEPVAAPPQPPQPPPARGVDSLPVEVAAVTSAAPAIRVYRPSDSALNAPWTVLAPAGDPCDLHVNAPRGFEFKDTAVEVVNEGRAKGLTVKPADAAGTHVAAFRGDRAAPWGPREFTIVFKRGGASARIRLRIQVVRPSLLSLAPPPALKEALQWLERHQARDGSISANGFSLECRGERSCDGAGMATCTTGVTALAVLAALRSGESGEWIRSAVASLVAAQKSDGRFGGDDGHGAYTHMITTEAVALAWHLIGGAEVRDAAQRGVEAIEAARNLQAAGGAWRYRIQDGDNDTSVTIWAMRALLTARIANLKVSEAAIQGGAAWIRRVTETNPNDPGKGRIGYRAPGELPIRAPERALAYPPQLSESLTAGALSVALLSGDRKHGEDVALAGMALVLLCRPAWDGSTTDGASFIRKRLNNPGADLSVISSRDFYYWQNGTHLMRAWKLLRARSIPEEKKWNLQKVLTPVQRKDLCFAGSFDPNDPWGPELGRAGSTALLALALANERYSDPVLDEVAQ